MTLYCAIDLHSTNNVPVVIDEQDNILFQKRLPNHLPTVINALAPFKNELHGVAVESTFNWYWLVDGLDDNLFNTFLVHPPAVTQYDGIKHTNDHSDAFHLAHLMRLGILPTAYIYPKSERAVRDMLRKRLQLVRHRVTHMLSAQNQIWRSTGLKLESKLFKQVDFAVLNQVDDKYIKMAIKSNLIIIQSLNEQIDLLENTVLQHVKIKPEFLSLLTVDGIGKILAMTIMLETGNIHRFPSVGQFASYARCVDSHRSSNGKSKGVNNRKNGNKYLSWAFVEAAHCIIRHNKTAHKFYQRKRTQKNGALATKALAHKMARAAYHVIRNQEPFNMTLLFR